MCSTGSLFLFARFDHDSAPGATQTNSCLLWFAPTSTSCLPTGYGNIAQLPRMHGTAGPVDPISFIRTACWNDGPCKIQSGKNESPLCFMKIDTCAVRRVCARCVKRKRNPFAPMDCEILFA